MPVRRHVLEQSCGDYAPTNLPHGEPPLLLLELRLTPRFFIGTVGLAATPLAAEFIGTLVGLAATVSSRGRQQWPR